MSMFISRETINAIRAKADDADMAANEEINRGPHHDKLFVAQRVDESCLLRGILSAIYRDNGLSSDGSSRARITGQLEHA